MHTRCDTKLSNYLNINIENVSVLRMTAMFMVIMCHTCHLVSGRDYSAYSEIMSGLFSSIGSLGVPVFYYISGFFFQKGKKTLKEFWKGKIYSIIIPWVVTSILVYLWGVIRKGGFSPWIMIKEIIGLGSYTWYLSVLLMLYLLCWIIKSKRIGIILAFCMSLLVTCIETLFIQIGMIHVNALTYFSIFRWLPFFCMGMFGGIEVEGSSKSEKRENKVWLSLLCLVGYFALFVIQYLLNGKLYYWSCSFQLSSIVFIICFTWINKSISLSKSNIAEKVEKYSFSMYLLHMPFAGIVANIFNRLFCSPIAVRPIIVFVTTYIFIVCAQRISCKLRIERIFDLCVGCREGR